MSTPRAFVSYSHDSSSHKEWVLQFATRLRSSGVDAILDLWELQPGDDLPGFMEKNLVSADRVLMVCTDKYVDKANAGTGGVGYEKMIVTADLMKSIDSNKVIPILRQSGTHRVPTFLSSKKYLDFSREEQFEFSFDELLRTLHMAPLFVKPAVGNVPSFKESPPATSTGDPVLALMKFVILIFESDPSTELIHYPDLINLANRDGMSRLYFDSVIQQAVDDNLLARVDPFLKLTAAGKRYALEHKLG